jgi:hypothetical protein
MPNKPIIDIDINSEPFKRFQKLFDQHGKDVKKVNDAWEAMVAQASKPDMPSFIDKMNAGWKKTTATIVGAGAAIATTVRHAASLAATVEKIAVGFAKIGVAAGTLGGLSFWGVDKLANSVFQQGKAASGAGITTGQLAGFRIAMSPMLGSPENLLGAAAGAQFDMSKWAAMSAMGINPIAAQQESPFDLAIQMQTRARSMWMQNHNLQMMEAMGVTQFFSPEDLRRMGNTSDRDFSASISRARASSTSLGFDADTTKTWTDLKLRIDTAGAQIEKVLVEGLARLAGPLDSLSTSVVHMIDAFSRSPEVRDSINALARGVESIAKYFGGGEQYSSPIGPDMPGQKDGLPAHLYGEPWLSRLAPSLIPEYTGPIGPTQPDSIGPKLLPDYEKWLDQKDEPKPLMPGYEKWLNGPTKMSFGSIESMNGLPPGLLGAVYRTESGGGRFMRSPKGALGAFGFMPDTAAQYGVDPMDTGSSARGAGSYLHDLVRMFGGDVDKGLAAYNWGPGNLRKDIAKYGSGWRQHLPQETRDYLDKIHAAQGDDAVDVLRSLLKITKQRQTGSGARVSIDNNTSAQVAVQANGAI